MRAKKRKENKKKRGILAYKTQWNGCQYPGVCCLLLVANSERLETFFKLQLCSADLLSCFGGHNTEQWQHKWYLLNLTSPKLIRNWSRNLEANCSDLNIFFGRKQLKPWFFGRIYFIHTFVNISWKLKYFRHLAPITHCSAVSEKAIDFLAATFSYKHGTTNYHYHLLWSTNQSCRRFIHELNSIDPIQLLSLPIHSNKNFT